MPAEPEHARNQILNDLAAQEDSGLVPGSIYMHGEAPRWSHEFGHPPMWPVARPNPRDFSTEISYLFNGKVEIIYQMA